MNARAVGGEWIVAQYRDITELRELQRGLEHAALHDALTGLPNRRLFMHDLEQALARLPRTERAIGVVFCDVDGLKLVNDTFGHAVGDQALLHVADSLHTALRPSDSLARLSGDEFVVLAQDLDGAQDALSLATRLHQAIKPLPASSSAAVRVGLSMGVTVAHDAVPVDQVLSEADAALYEAKRRGRGRVVLFDAGMGERSRHRYHLENDLRAAVQRGEFALHYQPKYDLATGRPVGVEALLRWQHPTRGLLHPGVFLEALEETGLIVEVGAWVLRTACAEACGWAAVTPQPPVVEVNLAAAQLATTDIVDQVHQVLTGTGLAPERLELEVTEHQALTDLPHVIASLGRLRRLGVGVALDDFGAGYSSLSWLQRLPACTLKLDRSLLAAASDTSTGTPVARAVIDLGHALGLQVVAEGVETAQQLDLVRKLGADQAQGFYLSRPLPQEQVRGLLARSEADGYLGRPGVARAPEA
nr:bifunctional diguanylate cyclase/phosphodiesterase [Motilibacter aurantiacus]